MNRRRLLALFASVLPFLRPKPAASTVTADQIRDLQEKLAANYQPIVEVEYIEYRALDRDQICRLFAVEPEVVGNVERSTFANLEEERARFVRSLGYTEPHVRRSSDRTPACSDR